MTAAPVHDVLILGGGIHGLSAAFALRQRHREVTVLDRFSAGHRRGGSHGNARITRSSYHDRRYVELAQRAHSHAWPRLEAELGERLVHRSPGVFFGPADGPFGQFLAATLDAGVAVQRIERATAARQFPLLRFEPGDAVMLDHTAGVLAAERTILGLRRWLGDHGVELRDGVRVTTLRPTPNAIEVTTTDATLRARAVVVATGAWLGELLPEWASKITVLRQQVGYVRIAAEPGVTGVGAFPVWARIGAADADFEYGLPEFERAGLKLGVHRTQGRADDPEVEDARIDDAALLAQAKARFAAPVEGLIASEHCLYAVTEAEHLHVAPAMADPRIVAVAACSGHGFKFGPVLADRVADLVDAAR